MKKKISTGHQGFSFQTSPNISLEQDLQRRDITINAIAEDENGILIDPFNGIDDLHQKIIRHVSNAFIEDPLRILRVARFHAKLNFNIAPTTLTLMKTMVVQGALQELSQDRINLEFNKALMLKDMPKFFIILHNINALQQIFTAILPLMQHKIGLEILHTTSTFMHQNNYCLNKRFAVWSLLIQQYNTTANIDNVIQTYAHNNQARDMATLLIRAYAMLQTLNINEPNTIFQLLSHLDPIRRHKRYLNCIALLQLGQLLTNESIQHKIFMIEHIVSGYQDIPYQKLIQQYPDTFIAEIKKYKYTVIEQCSRQYPQSHPSDSQ